MPDLYLILSPDLVILTASDAYLSATLTNRAEVVGRALFEVFPDNPAARHSNGVKNLRSSLQQVLATKKPHRMGLQHYDVPKHDRQGGGFAVKYWLPVNSPVLNERGEVHYIIHKVEEVTELVTQLLQKEHQALGKGKEQPRLLPEPDAGAVAAADGGDLPAKLIRFLDTYRLVVEHTPDVITRWDRNLKLIFANPAFGERTGVSNMLQVGKSKKEMGQPEEVAGPWMEKLRQVFVSAKAIEHYNTFHTPNGPAFFYTRLVPESGPDGQVGSVLAIGRDITEINQTYRHLEASNATISRMLSGAISGIILLDTRRNDAGKVVDFVFRGVNKAFEQVCRLPDKAVVGRGLLEVLPGTKEVFFAQFVKVVETGEALRKESYYGGEHFNHWFDWSAVKNSDGLILTFHDITDRKKAEQDLHKQYQVLRQSEEVARMGSWEYDLSSDALYWSEGMYQLFGLPAGSFVSLETYLNLVVEEDLAEAEHFIRHMRQAKAPLDLVLRLRVAGRILTLRIKTYLVCDEKSQAAKILGLDVDISQVKRLEQENLQIRLDQQKQLLLAMLEAQDKERKRISESLHNGVGQILFAAKLNLRESQKLLRQDSPENQALQSAQDLLTRAITETRQASHELVPALLQEFGLEEALDDLCSKYDRKALRVNFKAEGLQPKLPPHLEIALLRISQELINNVAKHAQATQADLLLSKQGEQVLLQVRDNGKGFRYVAGKTKGLGLKAIEDRIKLLNGSLSIDRANKGEGTLVNIRISASGL